jgi:hypothetical protein
MFLRTCRTALFGGLFLILFSCDNSSSLSPYAPDDEVELSWQELLSSDSSYPDNVYLTNFVEWEPGIVGTSRQGGDYTDSEGRPLDEYTLNALGPPEGSGSGSSGDGLTCPLGINGWGVWEFDSQYVIVNGEGDDFITFTKTFAWGSTADGLCSELAHVEVSEDGETWYAPNNEAYDSNSSPSENNSDYLYDSVNNLHGNAPTWANFRTDMQAESLETLDGVKQWVEVPGVTVSRYFTATDDYLGGIAFDLEDFYNGEDQWPSSGKMKYLKIIDDDTILDGQDYDKSWCLGANLMSAMGINTELAGDDS